MTEGQISRIIAAFRQSGEDEQIVAEGKGRADLRALEEAAEAAGLFMCAPARLLGAHAHM